MNRTLTLFGPADAQQQRLIITQLEGCEALSELGYYTLTLQSLSLADNVEPIDLKSLIGTSLSVHIELEQESGIASNPMPARWLNGLVEKARFIGHDPHHAQYEVVIRPWLFLLGITADFKIYQQKSVVDILEEVLAEYEYAYSFKLQEQYPLLDYQVQYGETDLDFIQRLMEKWGIYWYVEHGKQSHKIIFVDGPLGHSTLEHKDYVQLPYLAQEPAFPKPYIQCFHYQEMLTTGQWVTSDYDFSHSRKSLEVTEQKPRKTQFNQMEIYAWPGDYQSPAIGEQLSRIRIEACGAQGNRCHGRAAIRGLCCGNKFSLTHYPVVKANRDYFIISTQLTIKNNLQHSGNSPCETECTFTVQPINKHYRHPQRTAKPRTYGPQTAVVTGPEDKEIWTDQFGRVKVRFQWDRYAKNSEADSCWLRVSQAWAGNRFGGMYIPRIGHEVIVDFIQGDPDRPLIIGSLYNDSTMPPWALPHNGSQSGLVSRSLGGNDENFNGIRFEDKLGQEQYWEQAERDMHRLTKQNEQQIIGASREVNVGGSFRSTVAGTSDYFVGGAIGVTVGGTHTLTAGTAVGVNAGGAIGINAGGAIGIASGGAMSMVTGGAMGLAVGGVMGLSAGGELVISASRIRIIADGQLVLQAAQIDLNPGDSGPRGGGGGGGIIGIPGIKPVAGLFVGRSKIIDPTPEPTPTGSTFPDE